jgi:hypothetical protein
MAPVTENGSETSGGAEITEMSTLAQSACSKGHSGIMSNSSGGDELHKDMVSPYQFDKSLIELGKAISRPGKNVQVEDESFSSEHFDVNTDKDRVINH